MYFWPALFSLPDPASVFADLNAWWRQVRDRGEVAVVFAYSLGKAQRILNALDPSIGPIICHRTVEDLSQDYRETGIVLPETLVPGRGFCAGTGDRRYRRAPPAVAESGWLRQFGDYASALSVRVDDDPRDSSLDVR